LDRLSERDYHDQPVALDEVSRHELPPFGAEEEGARHVERECRRPQRSLKRAVRKRRRHQQPYTDRSACGEPEHRASQLGVISARDDEENDVGRADHGVSACEHRCRGVECLRNAHGDDQEGGHRGEHREPDDTLLRVHDTR
jgi:hypothetical protein